MPAIRPSHRPGGAPARLRISLSAAHPGRNWRGWCGHPSDPGRLTAKGAVPARCAVMTPLDDWLTPPRTVPCPRLGRYSDSRSSLSGQVCRDQGGLPPTGYSHAQPPCPSHTAQ